MRYLKDNELNEIRFEVDMLQGCINRMCITKDLKEFKSLQLGALQHIDFITSLASKRFEKSEV